MNRMLYILWEKVLFSLNLQFPSVIILIVYLLDCYKLPYASDAWKLKNNVFSQFGLKPRLLPVSNHCLNLNVLYSFMPYFFQLKKELSGKPLREALDDQTLPLCWKGRNPFKSIRDVKKYFKTFALSFTNERKSKTELEFPPEAYLIISVSPPFNSFPTFDFSSLIYSSIRRSLCMSMNAWQYVFPVQGKCLLGNSKWHRSRAERSKCHWRWEFLYNSEHSLKNWDYKPRIELKILLNFLSCGFIRHINARQSGDLWQRERTDWMGPWKLQQAS